MGTKVDSKSYLPGNYSMRGLNVESSNNSWPLFYGDEMVANGHYYNTFLPRTVADAYLDGDKSALKQTILEHEYIFKHQVSELHRLYKVQRDMMDEIKRKEMHKHWIPMETSSLSSPLVTQMQSDDAWKWHKPSFPLANSVSTRTSISSAEMVNSPLSYTKANSTQIGRSPSQNGSSTKEFGTLESRPSKVRKKLFDLQLPADEYIDTEQVELSLDTKISDMSHYPPSRNHKIASDSSVKMILGGGTMTDCDGDASRSGSCLKNSVRLADLNEPLEVEEMTFPASVDFIGRASCRESNDLNVAAKPKSHFPLNSPKEIVHSLRGTKNGNNLCVERNGREWLSYRNQAGNSKTKVAPCPRTLQPDQSNMPPQPMGSTLNHFHQPLEILPSDHGRLDRWREKTVCGLELSERNQNLSRFNHLGTVVASRESNAYVSIHASDLDNAWSPSVSSWGKPNGSLTQKLTEIQSPPHSRSSGNLGRNSESSVRSLENFIDKRHLNGSFGSDLPKCNGFYHESSSGSKDAPTHFPLAGSHYLNCNKDDKVSFECSINCTSTSYLKGSNVIGVDLNPVLSKCSTGEFLSQHGLEHVDEERKCEDNPEVCPWLKSTPAGKSVGATTRWFSKSSELSFLQAVPIQLSKSESGHKQFTPNTMLASSDRDVRTERNEVGDCQVKRKIPGFPIFDHPSTPKNVSSDSSHVLTSESLCCPPRGEDMSKNGFIDINLACDPESDAQIAAEVLLVAKGKDTKVSSFRTPIDLNSLVCEDELTVVPSVASTSVNVKNVVEIDLEVPAVPETEEDILPVADQKQHEMPLKSPQHEAEQPRDEADMIAAEAIVALSSSNYLNHVEESTCHPPEATPADSLLLFLEVVSSYADILDGKFNAESRGKDGGDNGVTASDKIDYFETMTLGLTEMKEEEYMPKPLVPENRHVEETGTLPLPNQPRKGRARRGRQRRDFQRDVLPGLASLLRHEVTEDLQAFGGLMRATGHPWNLGLTRRNGGGRGRRRTVVDPCAAATARTLDTPLMQQLNNLEVGLEDRSLTGWGKTTRRPRRQRYPAGNPPLHPFNPITR